ncbi:MAG: SAM-dependent chlorinase/fluorinase [Anaerolineae bacterium]|nr:SAM-dependent chlorinase/fluorinase [Anaerolineae bacterium]
MSIITITTDFGIKNEFVAVMKGVILGISPAVQIVDVTHAIAPQNILEGAFALWRAASFFPDQTIHLFVVDPGVGTSRRAIAARIGSQYFVGPDNGLLTPIIESAEQIGSEMKFIHLQNSKYFLPIVSRTFHGRDIFSPVAAHIANGVALAELGAPISDPVRLALPKPTKTESGWTAHITVVDIFGNLTLDLPSSALQNRTAVLFRLHQAEISGVVDSYGQRSPGDLVAVVDSEGFIEIAEVNGSAAKRLNVNVGDMVEVILSV